MHFTIHLDDVVPAEYVTAHITGDIEGTAELAIIEHAPERAEARLTSSLAPSNGVLRTFGRVARPVKRAETCPDLTSAMQRFPSRSTMKSARRWMVCASSSTRSW